MAVSEAEICNRALVRVGVRDLINSLSENKVEARVCKAVFAGARDEVLEAFDWPFATKRELLAQVANVAPEKLGGYSFQYSLPTDCLHARHLWAGTRTPRANQRIPFTIDAGSTAGTRVLLTDAAEAILVYTARIEAVPAFSPLFVDALAWRLASELALSLPVKPQLGVAALQRYRDVLNEAVARALEEVQEDPEPESIFISGRR